MFGKPGKNLSAIGPDDAQAPFDQPESLSQGADDARCRELSQRPYEKIQNLRKRQGNIEALRDSEAWFRAGFKNAAVGIARVAPDGRWLEVNQRLCDIIGYTREELMTKTFGDITHSDDLEQDVREMRRILAGEIETYLKEKRFYHKDGSFVWANLSVSLMRKADGTPDYFISIVEDISARKRVEEANLKRVALLSDPLSGKRPDALILDIAMPDEDGYTVLKKVRALEAEQGAEADQIPAVALTACGRSEDRLHGLQAGFHMHVAKPVEPAELAMVIASLVGRLDGDRAL